MVCNVKVWCGAALLILFSISMETIYHISLDNFKKNSETLARSGEYAKNTYTQNHCKLSLSSSAIFSSPKGAQLPRESSCQPAAMDSGGQTIVFSNVFPIPPGGIFSSLSPQHDFESTGHRFRVEAQGGEQ